MRAEWRRVGVSKSLKMQQRARLSLILTAASAVDTPEIASALLVGHGPARCGFFLAAAVPQSAPEVGISTPFVGGGV